MAGGVGWKSKQEAGNFLSIGRAAGLPHQTGMQFSSTVFTKPRCFPLLKKKSLGLYS
jgi:hypothetical protein